MLQESTIEIPKTRGEILRDKVQIRLALDVYGKDIEKILAENDVFLPGADFSKVFPHWIIAMVEDEVIGCLQVMPAKPIGWLEMLAVKPSVSFKLRAIAMRKLMQQGIATLYLGGSQLAFATVGTSNKKMKSVLEKINFSKVFDAEIMVKSLIKETS
jgi:hypothetical protein